MVVVKKGRWSRYFMPFAEQNRKIPRVIYSTPIPWTNRSHGLGYCQSYSEEERGERCEKIPSGLEENGRGYLYASQSDFLWSWNRKIYSSTHSCSSTSDYSSTSHYCDKYSSANDYSINDYPSASPHSDSSTNDYSTTSHYCRTHYYSSTCHQSSIH